MSIFTSVKRFIWNWTVLHFQTELFEWEAAEQQHPLIFLRNNSHISGENNVAWRDLTWIFPWTQTKPGGKNPAHQMSQTRANKLRWEATCEKQEVMSFTLWTSHTFSWQPITQLLPWTPTFSQQSPSVISFHFRGCEMKVKIRIRPLLLFQH